METIHNSQESDRVFVSSPFVFQHFLQEKKIAYRGKKRENRRCGSGLDCLACEKPCSESLALEKKRKKKKEKKSRKDDWEMFIPEEINIQHFDVFPQILSLGLITVLWLESRFKNVFPYIKL